MLGEIHIQENSVEDRFLVAKGLLAMQRGTAGTNIQRYRKAHYFEILRYRPMARAITQRISVNSDFLRLSLLCWY